jgi:hypothetical protein
MAGFAEEQQTSVPLAEATSPNNRLMRALWHYDHDSVASALQSGASPNYVALFTEFKTDFGGTGWASRPERLISALGLAAQQGDLASMQVLIDAGADLNMHARASQSNLPASRNGLEMTRTLIQKGYRPTAQDIMSALDLRKTPGWEDWSVSVLTAPGVPQRLPAIRAGTDPDYRRLIAEQADEGNQASHENEAFERQMQVAQRQALAAQNGHQAVSGAEVGDMVCSKPGTYSTKYVAYVESRTGDRVELKILGAFNRTGTDFKPQEMRWDDIDKWIPCDYR